MTFPPDRGRKRGYIKNILVGWDQSLGTWWGIDADETISSYVGQHHPHSYKEAFINWLFNNPNHCKNNIET